ncbi:hypothetical protein NLM33_02395 [Bradyrhizobium sp. CCGUVB1N3]|uniref:hypothetical protein n=1 Tax=Bradyrhizobium sp. CCGUVB1N3 TaxID=2949629 RepID=UPI0020B36D16|nr:hypothetical protein [Bradyrhizobium sp. CCGUVB1N3]MCP3469173.1 hypothetical protein [Bradyrhizobium sp. CCGUVB1N3]
MVRHISQVYDAAADPRPDTQHRCLNCNGVIAGLADQDLGLGLDTRVGLVSDECALICNVCTAKLIETRASEPVTAASRR